MCSAGLEHALAISGTGAAVAAGRLECSTTCRGATPMPVQASMGCTSAGAGVGERSGASTVHQPPLGERGRRKIKKKLGFLVWACTFILWEVFCGLVDMLCWA